ncbi:hypothetical protein PV05_05978 [Exophiala xenobiotica]|uniref:Uncharacterized protein n=1 Tax=Exophiala xenobiotica TaxID=348802 RepID=A0A0D2EPJ6_9EURO|nr:uncharacterized protein PV05_05978 [Exophiala xenobiotica]KIW57428.1 hypothetical protein PV05_05978 [Exophiala xenobiotica]
MSVSGFSVQHDPEVQAYNKLRATYLAAEKERRRDEKSRKQEEKKLLESFKKDRRMKSRTGNRNVVSRILHPVGKDRDERLLPEVMGAKSVDSESDLDEVSLKEALR